MSDYFGQRNKDIYPRTAASLCTPSHLTMTIINRENSFTSNQREETVDHVSLYLTPLAFGAPTGGNAPCSNMFGKKILNLKKLLPNEQTAILLILQARYRQYQATKR
ncbi:hypothetical protein T12_4418 [Trichinella patagoniensis]|uniref:Uncharacterized protein n=1 Tax=Trichinella patagoniensis TaxID=990121 RepID=A0A0V1A9M0_9BILA|nr:hypothetical protein T12_4418 [Trichinella patagoniensis]